MLQALERGLEKFKVDYYLVGAVSRDVWMSGIHGITPRRGTKDFDFAVFINDKGIYEQLKQYLLDKEDFTDYKENAFVLIWKNGMQVDLLPFGAIEDDNRRVTVEGTGFTSVHVDGFREVYNQHLDSVELEGGQDFKVCSLPGYTLLKLIAWDDRPEARRDDITDISDILQHFFDMYRETIWNEHYDLFEADNFDPLTVGARVMGREIRKLTVSSATLHQRVQAILEVNTRDIANSPVADIMRQYFDNTVEDCVHLIREIKSGFEEVR